jgi:hypothetical protein
MQVVFRDEVFRAPLIQHRAQAMLRLCRKIIFQEFGIKLLLTQEDLLEQIIAHAKRSKNADLHQLVELLQNELGLS